MPRGGGRELIDALRSRDATLPIVVMTGYISLSDEKAIQSDDRLVVMQKPIDVERLLRLITEFTG